MSKFSSIIDIFKGGEFLKAVIIGTFGVAVSWYDIKSDIKQLKVFQEGQVIRDAGQDQALKDSRQEIRETLKENKDELKQELRDLRRDLGRATNGRSL